MKMLLIESQDAAVMTTVTVVTESKRCCYDDQCLGDLARDTETVATVTA